MKQFFFKHWAFMGWDLGFSGEGYLGNGHFLITKPSSLCPWPHLLSQPSSCSLLYIPRKRVSFRTEMFMYVSYFSTVSEDPWSQDLFKHIAGWKSSTRRDNNQGTKWQGWGTKNERGFYLDKEWDVLRRSQVPAYRQGPSVMQILPNHVFQQSGTFVSNGSKDQNFYWFKCNTIPRLDHQGVVCLYVPWRNSCSCCGHSQCPG